MIFEERICHVSQTYKKAINHGNQLSICIISCNTLRGSTLTLTRFPLESIFASRKVKKSKMNQNTYMIR